MNAPLLDRYPLAFEFYPYARAADQDDPRAGLCVGQGGCGFDRGSFGHSDSFIHHV